MSVCPVDLPFYSSHYEVGVSTPAQELTQYVIKIRNHASQSISLGWREPLNQQLMDVLSKCNLHGWDGYDANPINHFSIYAASRFLDLLPNNIEIPEIVPEPTGEIGFLWTKGKYLTFVVSVNPDKIIYAGLLGASKNHGETKFLNELPYVIERILLDYFVLS